MTTHCLDGGETRDGPAEVPENTYDHNARLTLARGARLEPLGMSEVGERAQTPFATEVLVAVRRARWRVPAQRRRHADPHTKLVSVHLVAAKMGSGMNWAQYC